MTAAASSRGVPSPDGEPVRSGLPVLLTLLLLTAAILLLWSHFKPLDQDEVFVLQTDGVPSVSALIGVQRHTPISLDPLFYHLLSHASIALFGVGAFAIRLPSLLGYLLMQMCLFFIAGTVAGRRAGFIAAAVPALTATLFYGVEARPYGVLLGLSALILLGWQRSIRGVPGHRVVALATLAIALALALNTHYFAVLLLIPLCAAELFRTVQASRAKSRLHIDWPVIVAIGAGMAGIAFALPFQKPAGEFRKNYYNAGKVGLHAVTQSYRALFVNYTTYSMAVQHALGALLLVGAALLLWTVWRSSRSGRNTRPAEQVYLVVLAAMPFFGFLLARFVTHSIEVRYVLSAIVGIAVLIGIVTEPLLRSGRRYLTAITLLLMLTAVGGMVRVREERAKRDALLASLTVSNALRQQLLATPGARLYVQNLGFFDEITQYLPEEIRSRTVLLYSRDEELRWLRHDTGALTAMHMQHFTSVPTTSYEDLQQQPGKHLLLLHPDGWEWLAQALRHDGATVVQTPLTLDGKIVAVQFRAGEQPR